jgi:hypothetical protein
MLNKSFLLSIVRFLQQIGHVLLALLSVIVHAQRGRLIAVLDVVDAAFAAAVTAAAVRCASLVTRAASPPCCQLKGRWWTWQHQSRWVKALAITASANV